MQINLQHSRAATYNLIKIVTEYDIDIVFIQEPYTIQDKVIGIPTKYITFTAGPRPRAVVTDKGIDITMLSQLSDRDAVTVEVLKGNTKIIACSMYFDRETKIGNDLEKMERMLRHARNNGILIAADTNSRSALWYDRITNERGRTLEEFLTTKQLYFSNEDSRETIFSSSIGNSNIDLTISNLRLLSSITEWEINSQESLSDHRIIKFAIKQGSTRQSEVPTPNIRYKTNKDSLEKLQGALLNTLQEKFGLINKGLGETDDYLSSLVTERTNIETMVEGYNEALRRACNNAFIMHSSTRHPGTHKSVPWWTSELTALRKRTNALRRRYQRTQNDEGLRNIRKKQYIDSKNIRCQN